MAFVVAVVVLVLALATAAYFVLREQHVPSKYEVAKEFDPEECARAILEALPFESQERLGIVGARQVVSYVLDYLKLQGAVANGDDSGVGSNKTIIFGNATSTKYILERAASGGIEVSPSEAHAVVLASVKYLSKIGAIGGSASGEDVSNKPK